MRWRTNSKSAWALIVDETDSYKHFPLYRILGKRFIENILDLNLKWQLENLAYIREVRGTAADIYIFITKNNQPKVKQMLKIFPKIKKVHTKKIPVKSSSSIEVIISGLLKKYARATVWNIASLVISGNHLDLANNGVSLLTIKSAPQGRPVLISSCSESGLKEENKIEMELPSIYDLESLRDTIYFMSLYDFPEYSLRARQLAEKFLLILESL